MADRLLPYEVPKQPRSDTLYEPEYLRLKASPSLNRRTMGMYRLEKLRLLGEEHPINHPGGSACKACTRFRQELARDLAELATRLERQKDVTMWVPGIEGKPIEQTQYPDEPARRADAAYTRIREFEQGQPQHEGIRVAIEMTIADRNGWAFPSEAYQVQGQLNLEATHE